jgi:rhodanese-related sulfurtransferase
MKKAALIAVVCTLTGALASAQMKKPKTEPAPQPSPLRATGMQTNSPTAFPRISMEDAVKLYSADKAVFIDVRSNEQFSLGHIKGALSIPGSQLIRRFKEVPHGKTIIAYCACSAEQSSGRAVNELIAHGVKNAFALKGGWNEWKAKRHPIAAGPK